MPGLASSNDSFAFTARSAQTTHSIEPMKDEKPFIIRSNRPSDRAAVRRLCCRTGFLGEPIDPAYEDHALFADFLTTYYTDKEADSSFVPEVTGQSCGSLLASPKHLRN